MGAFCKLCYISRNCTRLSTLHLEHNSRTPDWFQATQNLSGSVQEVMLLQNMIVVKTKIVKWVIETMGITLSCQPQNWLLVANSEVGNSEYIHYSELPTPLIIVYLV